MTDHADAPAPADAGESHPFVEQDGWLSDASGNKSQIAWFGSRDAAEAALRSLKNCQNCSNCSDCSRCSGCSGCSACSGCSGCSGCSACSRCSACSDCSRCSDCSGCSCCLGCSRCSRCSGCSDCSGCSGCSGCSHVAYLIGKNDLKGDPDAEPATPGQPSIPKIENIHARVFAAASQPNALDMATWHTCNTTHCRAGWVVHLAGEAGYALEHFHNTALAAQLIYRESGHPINPCRFYDSDEDALADMKRLADEKAQAT